MFSLLTAFFVAAHGQHLADERLGMLQVKPGRSAGEESHLPVEKSVAASQRLPVDGVVGDNQHALLDQQHQQDVEAASPTANTTLSRCAQLAQGGDAAWEQRWREALAPLCASELAYLFDVSLDPRFQKQYERWYGEDGWAEAAWVNYLGVRGPGDRFGRMTERLARSVRRASQYPLVILNVGEHRFEDIDPAQYPNVVVFNTKALVHRVSFNFNKLRAVLAAKVKTGVSLDSDMLMIGKQADRLLQRTAEEITETYPLPMMPVHFLDRDPEDATNPNWRKGQTNFLQYSCPGCPKESMRWGQAQPSWTYWSLPFLGQWLRAKLLRLEERGVRTASIGEDEDLLNVGLWQANASKEWCAFQPAGTEFIWNNLVPQKAYQGLFYDDPHYFPNGLPLAFYFIHGTKDIKKIDKALRYLHKHAEKVDSARPFFFQNKYYETFEELSEEHPGLNCIM